MAKARDYFEEEIAWLKSQHPEVKGFSPYDRQQAEEREKTAKEELLLHWGVPHVAEKDEQGR